MEITQKKFEGGKPCGHTGCLQHYSHPCESCGRLQGHELTFTESLIFKYTIFRFTFRVGKCDKCGLKNLPLLEGPLSISPDKNFRPCWWCKSCAVDFAGQEALKNDPTKKTTSFIKRKL